MEDALKARSEIGKRMRAAKRVALFLDFDGTLAPIVRDPEAAKMPEETKRLVERLAERMHTYIVTGRALKDIRKRASLKEVEYAGNHGLEWTRAGKTHRGKISRQTLADLREVLAQSRLLMDIPGALVEDKKYSISFHYRNIKPTQVPEFIRSVKAVLWPIVARGRTEILEQKKIIEVRMRGAHKGGFVIAALQRLPKGTLAIYIGDDTTDEDAFAALSNGITVRVGSGDTKARYRLATQKDVVPFLEMLLA